MAADTNIFAHIGVWLNREDLLSRKPGQLEYIFDQMAAMGVTHVYPELYFRGGAAYPSGVAPEHGEFRSRRILLDKNQRPEDIVSELLRLARERNIQVHPWVWVFCAGYWHTYGPILECHPEWAELDQDRHPFSNWRYGTAWLCPVLPAVREYLLAVLAELVTRWPVDGVHLDYIRYNEEEAGSFGFHPASLAQFREDTGMSEPGHGGRDADDQERRAAWTAWRAGNVTRFLTEAVRRLRALRPGIRISAAVVPDPDLAYRNACQEWARWAEEGLLDHVLPMAYRTNLAELRAVLTVLRERLAGRGRGSAGAALYPGLAVWVSPEEIVRQVEIVRELGFEGVTLFSTLNLTPAHYTALRAVLR
ncbi:MAG: family 10 glycosylhydrolase [Limnochordales bacterium]|nr:family 10 glycosylhydrolase [Limnochordales bacterium]